ncbi:MAG: hypothetical protein KJ888_20640, partial [Gammaproteobacteria bacterium]|nr:hypothetical protein [Gammaproteobacteria bacterium]
MPTALPTPAEMMQQRMDAQGQRGVSGMPGQPAAAPADPLAAQKAGLAASKPQPADPLAAQKAGLAASRPQPADPLAAQKAGLTASKPQPADPLAAQKAALEASKPKTTLPFLPDPLAAQKAGLEASKPQPGVSGFPGQTQEAPVDPTQPQKEAIAEQQAQNADPLAAQKAGLEASKPQPVDPTQPQRDAIAQQQDENDFQQAFAEGGFDAAFKKADEIAARRNEESLQKAFDEGGFDAYFKKADELSGGVPPDITRMADGNFDAGEATEKLAAAFEEGGFEKYFEEADKLVAATSTEAGSEPTEIETAGTSEEAVTAAVPDITQPDPDTVANNLAAGMDFDPESYAQSRRDSFQKQVDEGAMRLARRFALEIDPNSGEAQKFFENYYAQVASARNDLEASIATETAQIQQGNLAAVTGLIGTQGNLNIQKAQLSQRATELFGGEGTATLSSLGVPSMPDKYEKPDAFADADPKGFKQWINKIETSFFKENGRMPTDGELESLANGQAVVGKPTLAYQELVQRNQEFLATQRLEREVATGMITFAGMDTPTASLDRERFTETQREFDALQARQAQEWADKLGLDEAQVEDMLKTSAFQRDQTARMNSFSIASQMAELTGVAGFGTEDVTANTFGIQTDSIPEEVLSNNQALAQRPEFRALQQAARDLTGRELSGDQALSILRGDSVRMQGIPTLQSRQLAAEVTRSNQQYALDVERIAAENGLAADQLEMAMDQDARAWNQQTGRVSEEFGIPTDRYRTWKFGLDKQLLRAGTEQERQGILADSIEQFMEANPDLDVNAGDLIAANDMFDRLYGNDQLNIARQRGMQDEQWKLAKEQADLMQDQQEAVWAGTLGLAKKYQI